MAGMSGRHFTRSCYPCAPGGELAVDVYGDSPLEWFSGKDLVRPFTTRMDGERLFRLVESTIVPVLLPITVAIGRIPALGRRLRRPIPVSNYDGILPLDRRQLREWAILDTYDMLGPVYDQPQTPETLRQWFAEAATSTPRTS